MLEENEYQCALCKGIFEKVRNEEWSEEKALKEMKDNFGDIPLEYRVLVCDDCWQIIKRNRPN